MVTTTQVRQWLDAYVEAWRTYDPDLIGDLFTEDASYAVSPVAEPLRGREAIVSAWLTDPDEPGSWSAGYRPLLVDGDRAVAVGSTSYASGDTWENLWLLTFDGDARCSEFIDWYVERRPSES